MNKQTKAKQKQNHKYEEQMCLTVVGGADGEWQVCN